MVHERFRNIFRELKNRQPPGIELGASDFSRQPPGIELRILAVSALPPDGHRVTANFHNSQYHSACAVYVYTRTHTFILYIFMYIYMKLAAKPGVLTCKASHLCCTCMTCDTHTPSHPSTADEAWYWPKCILCIG